MEIPGWPFAFLVVAIVCVMMIPHRHGIPPRWSWLLDDPVDFRLNLDQVDRTLAWAALGFFGMFWVAFAVAL